MMNTTLRHRARPLEPWAEHAARLLRFNDDVLAQAEDLAEAYARAAAPAGAIGYRTLIGPHLRHIIEHYAALLLRPYPSEVDYDARPRERALEAQPLLARTRIAELRAALAGLAGSDLEEPLLVYTLGGVTGQWPMVTASTLNRELVFLASHAVHHHALLREQCTRDGVPVAAHFGVAPASVAFAMRSH